MNILVLMKMVPDVVEELEIAAGGQSLDLDAVRMILSESDDHALEQALLMKERGGGQVTVLALDAPEVDDALFTALAKGADRAMKVTDGDGTPSTSQGAYLFAATISGEPGRPADLILTGVQAIDDLDGLVAPVIAHELGLPYLGIVTRLAADPAGKRATATREYPGGVRGEFEVQLPAVFGVQAAERPPRYVPVAKVRAAMKSQKIECVRVSTLAEAGPPLVQVVDMQKVQPAAHAQMLEGSPEQVSGRLCGILTECGIM
jgi:electron transfer flavoprotein beta subunit